MKQINVLVVDDSYFLRMAISRILNTPEINVIGQAKNGKEAVELVYELKPDVVTMDIEMPVMNGLEALKEIMSTNPTPVIMLSTLTSEGAESTIEALSIGAVDFVTKKSAFKEIESIKTELVSKILAIGRNTTLKNQLIRSKLMRKLNKPSTILQFPRENSAKYIGNEIEVIGIGVSTGGPFALMEILPRLPMTFPVPILIAQHMPPNFTKSLANRINSKSAITVKEAESGEIIKRGYAYLAQGGKHLIANKQRRLVVTDEPQRSLYKPSVEVMINSILDVFGSNTLGVMLTGMGRDGADAFKRIKSLGGTTLAQDPRTCVVSGMTGAVIANGSADSVIELSQISDFICKLLNLRN